MYKTLKIFAGSLILLLFCSVSAQTLETRTAGRTLPGTKFDGESGIFTPVWTQTIKVSSRANQEVMFDAPMFAGAGLDDNLVNLPVYEVLIPVGDNETIVLQNVSSENEVTEESPAFAQSVREIRKPNSEIWYPENHAVICERVVQRGKSYQILRLYPILVESSGRQIRKSESIRYSISRKNTGQQMQSGSNKTNTVSSSVLGNGTWYKIGITSEGIYQLDYNYLSNLGIAVSDIDPAKIQLYGNGGGILTQVAGEKRFDDLEENAILVTGQSDGSFDSGDQVLFYGSPQHQATWFEPWQRFVHRFNVYCDTTYYFLTIGITNGERIQDVTSTPNPTRTHTTTAGFQFYEKDEFNAILSGRSWLGEHFDFTSDRIFSFPVSSLASSTNVVIHVRAAARCNSPGTFTVNESGSNIGSISIANVNTNEYASDYYKFTNSVFAIPSSQIGDGSIDVQLIYNKPDASAEGWLDFLELEYTQNLVLNQNGFRFASTDSTGPGEVHEYSLTGASGQYMIWDITDQVNPQNRKFSLSGTNITFAADADSVKRYFAFTSSAYKSPVTGKKIVSQNLHDLAATEYLIIYNPAFATEAADLAQFHYDNFPGAADGSRATAIANIWQIYNEFSSGAQDPTAIRDFIRHMYNKSLADPAGAQLQWVLLFGDGGYDYKNIVSAGSNFIPTYQSRKSSRPTESYVSDDYFGFLDDGEGFWGENAATVSGGTDDLYYVDLDTSVTTHYLDVAVARLVVNSQEEARLAVEKVKNYHTNPSNFGDWRQLVLLVADHKDSDGTTHVSQADSYTTLINQNAPCYNVDKTYLDAYDMHSTANGQTFPDATEALHSKLNKGSLIVNYTGHGGETGWSNAKILEIPDIAKLQNEYRLPVYVTATCEFGRWDDPARKAGAEEVFLSESGGSIAMFTTVRVVYSGPNYVINTNFYKQVFKFDSILGRMPTLGEVFMNTKNASWLNGINNRNFTMLGDPALPLNYPVYKAAITLINGKSSVDSVPDSIASLSKVTVKGEVQDEFGNKLTTYSGDLQISVYDKPAKIITNRVPFTFYWQKNKLFSGLASVQNGEFTFEFVVPIDISYEAGSGKISLYFDNEIIDGMGCEGGLYVGGTGNITDDKSPELELYMNDLKFADGGLVGPDPLLLAKVYDDNGINTAGNGIGHELTAILDNNNNKVIVLNDYYTAEKNSYQDGTISYPFSELPAGTHDVTVKVWDVANNSAEGDLTFVVADDAEMALGHVLNYPNPFSSNTKFFVEHNRNGNLIDIQIKIFTVSGKLVKSLGDSFFAEGNLYCDLDWDGLDEYGQQLARGVYVYQVSLKQSDTGDKATKFEKLVLLR